MILIENVQTLKKYYPETWGKLDSKLATASSEVNDGQEYFTIEESRSGYDTMVYHMDGRKEYIHSRYDPIHEAEIFVQQYRDLDKYEHVLFYGLGLGYHIESIAKKYPNLDFSIYEPSPVALQFYLSVKNIKHAFSTRQLRHIYFGQDSQDINISLRHMMSRIQGEIVIITLPSYERIFKESTSLFYSHFGQILKAKKNQLRINFAFEKRWTLNSMINFEKVLRTPNFLLEKSDQFKGKPVVIVAAGPSLQDEIENLRKIKEEGLAYIFSVGSAISPLINNGIYPDAACTYDPTEHNQRVFAKLVEENIDRVPLIFGTSVGFETLLSYPGPKFHFLTSQDTVSEYLLKRDDVKDSTPVSDAPSIAVITLQLLIRMKCKFIILVGQNLAYRDKESYVKGIEYYDGKTVSDEEMKNAITVEDVEGNMVYTTEGFNRMRLTMEQYVSQAPMPVINTTVGGAKIKNTIFKRLEEVITEHLDSQVVNPDWHVTESNRSYDLEHITDKADKLVKAYEQLHHHFNEMKQIMGRAHGYVKRNQANQLEKLFIRWDKVFRRIAGNDFFSVILKPMNRVHVEILAQSMNSIQYEKNTIVRGQKIIEMYRRFFDHVITDYINIKPIFERFKESIRLDHEITSTEQHKYAR